MRWCGRSWCARRNLKCCRWRLIRSAICWIIDRYFHQLFSKDNRANGRFFEFKLVHHQTHAKKQTHKHTFNRICVVQNLDYSERQIKLCLRRLRGVKVDKSAVVDVNTELDLAADSATESEDAWPPHKRPRSNSYAAKSASSNETSSTRVNAGAGEGDWRELLERKTVFERTAEQASQEKANRVYALPQCEFITDQVCREERRRGYQVNSSSSFLFRLLAIIVCSLEIMLNANR